jgi:hypothetical protein
MPRRSDERFGDEDWDTLLWRIKEGKCTPFLGAGASYPTLPLGGEIARAWADEFGYPLADKGDLSRVAQFMSINRDPMFPKEKMVRRYGRVEPPDFTKADEPHGVLAELPLPIYLTSNYDAFMTRGLEAAGKKPVKDFCRWNRLAASHPSALPSGYEPTMTNPLVYHLHGHFGLHESMVLTEDDYLDFLVNVSTDQSLVPPRIKQAISGTSLLFVGYRLADWNFRVLFRGLVSNSERGMRRVSVTVQFPEPSGEDAEMADKIRDYLDRYFGQIDMRVYWGSSSEFAMELRTRWRDFPHD